MSRKANVLSLSKSFIEGISPAGWSQLRSTAVVFVLLPLMMRQNIQAIFGASSTLDILIAQCFLHKETERETDAQRVHGQGKQHQRHSAGSCIELLGEFGVGIDRHVFQCSSKRVAYMLYTEQCILCKPWLGCQHEQWNDLPTCRVEILFDGQ